MYEHSARAYDLITEASGKDYAVESQRVTEEIRRRRPDARTLLDVACGTGGHLVHLRDEFDVEGVDLSAAMLTHAQTKLGATPLHQGDLRTFRLPRRFDAITCLFSAVGYVAPASELAIGIDNMASHLVDGGVLIIEPWVHPESWRLGTVDAAAAKGDDIAVARAVHPTRSGTMTTLDMHWAVVAPDGITTFDERHTLALYTVAEYEHAMTNAGLTVEHDPIGLIGRGLFIGTKRGRGS